MHGIPILPNNQLALLADDKTRMSSLGEIDITLQRGPIEVRLKALVMDKLQADCFGGTTFHYDNDIQARLKSREIKLHNKYTLPQTNEHLPLPHPPAHSFLHLNKLTALLPDGQLELSCSDKILPDSSLVAVQPINNSSWSPQICPVIGRSVLYTNTSQGPVLGDKTTKFLCLPTTLEPPKPEPVPPPSPSTSLPKDSINILRQNTNSGVLLPAQLKQLADIHRKHISVFDSNLSSGYNGNSGKFQACLSFKYDKLPESKQCPVPLYNHNCLALQQQLMDQLEQQGVLTDPQKHGIVVKKVSPSFILQKGRAKHKKLEACSLDEIRWVVAFNNLNDDLLPRPSKATSGRNILTFLAKHNYHIHADLFNSYFQIPVRQRDWQWLGVRTPFRGIRVLTRAGQGLLNSENDLDELISRVLGEHILNGICYAERDDIIVGGRTIDEAITNWDKVLQSLADNNLKVSPSKVKIFPNDIEVFGHRIKDGQVLPSDHILTALGKSSIDQLKTVKQVNSWKGLYKTLLSALPSLAYLMDPFDRATSGKDSKDDFTWSPDLIAAFNEAMNHLTKVNALTLPNPKEQLILMPDGARTPGGIGWALFVQRKVDNINKLLPVQFYSAKVKPYMQKWLPCEIEGVAAAMAINACAHWILAADKPTYVTPDCKAVVEAVDRMRKGKLSRNPRLQMILISVNRRPVTFIHSSAKIGQHVIPDHASRLDITCGSKDCAVERFLDEIPDNVQCMKIALLDDLFTDSYPCHIAATSAQDLMSLSNGDNLPLGDRSIWISMQDSDLDISTVKDLLATGDSPRKNSSRLVKTIHRHASLKDGVVIVKESDNTLFKDLARVVIPKSKVPTILSMIHLKGNHPSQYQTEKIFSRYFFCPGFRDALQKFYQQCYLCSSVKKLSNPEPCFRDPDPPLHPGVYFNIDVLKRSRQLILVCTDVFSKYVTATIINSEKASDLASAILSLVTPVRRSSQITVKADAHPSFQSLKQQDILAKAGILLIVGEAFNKNSNCHVDKVIQELEHELRKCHSPTAQLSLADIANATFHLNTRLRSQDLSASEILFRRDQHNHSPLHQPDAAIRETTKQLQLRHHNQHANRPSPHATPGTMVMLKANPGKHSTRDAFVVTGSSNDKLQLQKLLNLQNSRNLRVAKAKHTVPSNHVFPILPTTLSSHSPPVQSLHNLWTPCSVSNHDSDDDTCYEGVDLTTGPVLLTDKGSTATSPVIDSDNVPTASVTSDSSSESFTEEVFISPAQSETDLTTDLAYDYSYGLQPYVLQKRILEKHRKIAARCRLGTSSLESLRNLELASRQCVLSSTRHSFLSDDNAQTFSGRSRKAKTQAKAKIDAYFKRNVYTASCTSLNNEDEPLLLLNTAIGQRIRAQSVPAARRGSSRE